MKAIVHDRYGPPDVLRLEDVPVPEPRDDEVRVRIHATTVNRTDTGFRMAEYLAVRLVGGLLRPRNRILGAEFAGVVETVGQSVTKFRVGERVFGMRTMKFGCHAEFVCVPESGSIATMPSKFSFTEAAAVLDGMYLAHNYLRLIDFTKPRKLLVNGASGSIGSAAVQLAKARGAEVTATCKTSLVERIRALGADHVVDYLKEDFTRLDRQFDVVLDMVGKSTFFACRRILVPRGMYYSSELGPWWQNPLLALVTPLLGGRKVGFPIPSDNQADVVAFRQLIEEGKYVAVIDRTYPLEQVVEATRYVETGEKTGNVVLVVVPET